MTSSSVLALLWKKFYCKVSLIIPEIVLLKKKKIYWIAHSGWLCSLEVIISWKVILSRSFCSYKNLYFQVFVLQT